ncbi:hypothetical protein [Candidatus Manganitrophus noduliformans]|uniref:Uncharacterized protein n=1 Tax=Candidatus Manganitrophus noduliformans TaxID=2606439 RepID=A0A7X6DNM5_9BACT|nr:hypothetical protein [Candidatus Manganitrophus noduliformans]NKE70417.1 hypothetical protein [Candidatus Manganitrophus noduliformans]
MNRESGHHSVPLAKSEFGSIDRCRCDGYHVSLRNIMLHFNREEFAALADLFKRAQEREEEAFLFSKWEE